MELNADFRSDTLTRPTPAMLDAMPGARDWHDWDNRRMRDAWYGADAAAKD